MRKKKNKVVSKATREKAEEALTELQNCPNGMFRLVNGLKTDSKEVDSGRCMSRCDGKLCFSEKKRGKVLKDYMERIMNEEHDLDHNVEGEAVEGPVVCVSGEEVLQALSEMKTGEDPGPFNSAVVIDVVTEFAREGALRDLLYAVDLVLMSDTIEVSSGITQDGLSKGNVDQCGVASLRVMVDSVLCVQCGRWIHGRCAGVKKW